MALCNSFNSLTVIEKVDFIGKLNHAVMNSELLFAVGKDIVSSAEVAGLFKGVIINPNREEANGEIESHQDGS